MNLLFRSKSPRRMGTVIALGHFAFAVKVLARLHLLQYQRLFCSGFFVRSPRWFPLFRILRRIDTPKDHYLIFSRSELALYADRVGIDPARLHYIPCGDWDAARTTQVSLADGPGRQPPGNYYFSGGYSNRDYVTLLKVFREIKAPLLIVCSKLNSEIDDTALPSNVRVVRDVPSAEFDDYISSAKAGVVPLKYDTGSSGQTVVLRLMRHAKPIVVSDVDAMRDYVEPGVSGYLVHDLAAELPGVIASIESDPGGASRVGQAAKARYEGSFSRSALSERFEKILQETDPNTALVM